MSQFSRGRFIFYSICLMIIFTPLAAGSVKIWFIVPVMLLIGLLVWWWLCGRCCNECEKIKWTPLALPSAMLAAILIISSVFSIYRQASSTSLLNLAGFAGLYFLVVNHVDDTRESRLISLIVGLAAVLSLVGLLQYFDFLPHSKWSPKEFLASTYVNHNHFAGYLELAMPLALGAFFDRQRKFFVPKMFFMLALIVMLLAFIFAQSRGAWISMFAALILMSAFLLKKAKIKKEGLLVFLSFIILAAFVVSLNSSVIGRRIKTSQVFEGEDFSLQTRLKIWKGAEAMIADKPFTGSGIGTFSYGFPRFKPEGLIWTANFAHNDYIELAAEAGIFALLFLFWIFFIIFRKGFIEFGDEPVVLGLATGIFSLAIHGFMDFNFHIPANMLLTVVYVALIMRRRPLFSGEANV